MQINSYKKTAGFTLLEAIIAIAILLVAIVGPMNISQKSLRTSLISKDEMAATFLAEDAIEAIRVIKDQYKINNYPNADPAYNLVNWLTPVGNCVCVVGVSCDLDDLPNAVFCNLDTTVADMIGTGDVTIRSHKAGEDLYINNNNINPLREVLDPVTGFFEKFDLAGTTGTFTQSKFSRYFNIVRNNPTEASVHVRVTWDSPEGLQQVNITHILEKY